MCRVMLRPSQASRATQALAFLPAGVLAAAFLFFPEPAASWRQGVTGFTGDSSPDFTLRVPNHSGVQFRL